MGQLDSGNAAWILTSASLVFLMTPGVAFFYGGMVRAKAVLNMMIMEAAALSVTMIMWVLWGWSIAYSGTSVGGIFGDPATGFLLKDTEPETLLNSIRTVFQGNAIIAPSATKRLIEKMMQDGYAQHGSLTGDVARSGAVYGSAVGVSGGAAGNGAGSMTGIPSPAGAASDGSNTSRPAYTDPELDLLTDREREVLVEIAHGLSNQEIADKLFISLPTVKTHVAHILAKINARDRVQAVVFAYDNGLV